MTFTVANSVPFNRLQIKNKNHTLCLTPGNCCSLFSLLLAQLVVVSKFIKLISVL